MTQEQLKEQFVNFAEFNLNNATTLQAIVEMLESISNELYEDGFTKEHNTLTTCILSIKEILENGANSW